MKRPVRPGAGEEGNGLREAVIYGIVGHYVIEDRKRQCLAAETYSDAAGLEVVGEYFDEVFEIRKPWAQRDQASRFLKSLEHPGSAIGVVVFPEPNRAFGGEDLATAVALLAHRDVDVHFLDGPVSPRSLRLRSLVRQVRRERAERLDAAFASEWAARPT